MRYRSDDGLTLIELLMALGLFVLAIGMFGASLLTAQRMQLVNGQYSRANDQAHLALQEIDRQIRSGYLISLGSPPTGTDAAARIYTEADGIPRCAVWVVSDGDPTGFTQVATLYTASWNPISGSMPAFGAAGWRPVATDLWNGRSAPAVAPFTVVTGGTDVLKTLRVDLRLNASTRDSATIEISSTFTSRNIPRDTETITGSGGTLKKDAAC